MSKLSVYVNISYEHVPMLVFYVFKGKLFTYLNAKLQYLPMLVIYRYNC